MYAPRRFSCPNVFHPSHEPAHVKIAVAAADRRTLRAPSTLHPDCAYSDAFVRDHPFSSTGAFSHIFDQMKHGAVNRPASYRLEEAQSAEENQSIPQDLRQRSLHVQCSSAYGRVLLHPMRCVLADRRTVPVVSRPRRWGSRTNTAAIMTVRSTNSGYSLTGAVAPRASGM